MAIVKRFMAFSERKFDLKSQNEVTPDCQFREGFVPKGHRSFRSPLVLVEYSNWYSLV
jgi:hypothetical protein